MAVYLVVDDSDNVVNRVEWDGVTPYDPSPIFGEKARLVPEPQTSVGEHEQAR